MNSMRSIKQPTQKPKHLPSLNVVPCLPSSGAPFIEKHCISINLTLRQRVLRYINQNLADPELSPRSIMQHFRLSHSHLYRAFEGDLGVARIIRNKRLDLAYRTILLNKHKPLSIKELAFKCGFSPRSQFSVFFKSALA